MTQYLADTGSPFIDRDAAELKAERMIAESSMHFDVVPVDEGYVIEPYTAEVAAEEAIIAATFRYSTRGQREPLPQHTISDEAAFVLSFRPAWRAQLAGFSLIIIGLVLVVAPTWPLALFSMDRVNAVNAQLPRLWYDIVLLGLGLGLGLLVAANVLWRRYCQHSVVSRIGIIQSVGILFNRRVSQIAWPDVHVVDVKQPYILHMLFNIGTVQLSTPSSGGADLAIVDVLAPRRVATFVREQIGIERSRCEYLQSHIRPSL